MSHNKILKTDVEPEGASLLKTRVEHANDVFHHASYVPHRTDMAAGQLSAAHIYPALVAFIRCNEAYNGLRQLAAPRAASTYLKDYARQAREVTVKAQRSLWEAQGTWLDRAEQHPNEALIKDWPGSNDFRVDSTYR